MAATASSRAAVVLGLVSADALRSPRSQWRTLEIRDRATDLLVATQEMVMCRPEDRASVVRLHPDLTWETWTPFSDFGLIVGLSDLIRA